MASIDELREARKEKLSLLREHGVDPYPIEASDEYSLGELSQTFEDKQDDEHVTVAGRIMSMRGQGKLLFFHFYDGTDQFQGVLRRDNEVLTDDAFELWQSTVDVGDIIQVHGPLMRTKRGEPSVDVNTWTMLAKSLRPLPDKWHGLQDPEERYRRRYLDILMNDDVRRRFEIRARFVRELRHIFDEGEYLEVETPILQPIAGGATAEAFQTHHNALDSDLYLRVAPELYLKELLVAGYPKVYELGRSFRNEGIDATHNPEFTTLEYYAAYSDAEQYRAFTEDTLREAVSRTRGTLQVTYNEDQIDFGTPFQVVPYFDLFRQYTSFERPEDATAEDWHALREEWGVSGDKSDPVHKVMDQVYKKAIRPELIQPTFLIDLPVETSPLAKTKRENERFIDRFQLVVGGLEIVNGYSEINDPQEQKQRFLEQEGYSKAGDEEAHPTDQAYVEALEYGMPPASGSAISIDRMTMILTDVQNIREVIIFPTLKPKSDE